MVLTLMVTEFRPPPPPRVRGYGRNLYYYRPGDLAASIALDHYVSRYGSLTPEVIDTVLLFSPAAARVRSEGGRGGEPRGLAAALLYYSLRILGEDAAWKEIYMDLGVPKQTAYAALRRLTEALGHRSGFHRLLARIEHADYGWTSGGRLLLRGLGGRPALVLARDGPWVVWERVVWGRTVYVPRGYGRVEAYTGPPGLLYKWWLGGG